MATNWFDLVLYFSLYSIVGWICESIWCSIGTGKLVNRGFLSGPYCPIYGFGALLILVTCVPLKAYPPLVFLVAMVAASILEYFTGWLMETLFHQRWWDYSKRKFNIKGRVCLRNALLFGLMGLLATYFVDPVAERIVGLLSPAWQRGLAIALLAVYAADLTHTLLSLLGLRKRLAGLQSILTELEDYNQLYGWFDMRDLRGSIERLRAICERNPGDETTQAILRRLDALTIRHQRTTRLLRAFPNLADQDFGAELHALREGWQKDIEARKQARRDRKANDSHRGA